MPKKGAYRKKTRTHVVEDETAGSALSGKSEEKIPRSLVVSELMNLVLVIHATMTR